MFNSEVKKRLERLEKKMTLLEELDTRAWQSLSQLKDDVKRLKKEETSFDQTLNSLEEAIDES